MFRNFVRCYSTPNTFFFANLPIHNCTYIVYECGISKARTIWHINDRQLRAKFLQSAKIFPLFNSRTNATAGDALFNVNFEIVVFVVQTKPTSCWNFKQKKHHPIHKYMVNIAPNNSKQINRFWYQCIAKCEGKYSIFISFEQWKLTIVNQNWWRT